MDEWVEQATCRSVDPELWFPEPGGYAWDAIILCAQCPVQRQCLKTSFDEDVEYGVWGGLTARRRNEAVKSYKTRTKANRDKMLTRILNDIDQRIEERAESMAATQRRVSEHKKELKAQAA